MIEKEALNNFKQTLNNLTEEPNWRTAKGEAIEDVVLEAQEPRLPAESDLTSDESSVVDDGEQIDDIMGEDFSGSRNSVSEAELMSDGPSGVKNEPEEVDFDDLDMDFDSLADDPGLDDLADDSPVSESDDLVGVDETMDMDDDLPGMDEAMDMDDDLPGMDEAMDMDDDLPGMDEAMDMDDDLPGMDEAMDMDDDLPGMDEAMDMDDDLPGMDEAMDMDDDLPGMDEAMDMDDDLPSMDGDLASKDYAERTASVEESDFDLGDFGDAAPVMGQTKSLVEEEDEDEEDEEEDEDEEEFGEDDLVFTRHKINKINDNLSKLPRNLRLALQDILASESTPPLVIRDLTNKLLRTPSARGLASDVRDITGQTIVVPRFYESHTGEAYEKRKATFSYNFSHLAWPKLRRLFVSSIFLAALFVTAFTFAYRPITALGYYRAGHALILQGEYDEAMRYFEVAFDGWKVLGGVLQVEGWPMQRWFFRYADAFVAQRQYAMAEYMYSLLMSAYPESRQAFVAYGEFEGQVRANFARADEIYFIFLNNFDAQDYAVLTARAENLLAWGEVEPLRLNDARDVLATLTSINEPTHRTMSNWLRLFVMTGQVQEIDRWVNVMRTTRNFQIDPVIMSQAAGWYLDNGRIDDAQQLLQFIVASGAEVPELFYQYARYFEMQGDLFSERDALDKALFLVYNTTPFTRQQTEMYINIFRRSGALRFAANMVDEQAQQELERAAALYENAIDRRILARQGRYGAIYKEIGDLFYIRDRAFVAAGVNYRRALDNFHDTPDLRYKQGYIFYSTGDYEQALANLYAAYSSLPEANNILYSLGTVMYKRGNFFGAQDMYDELRRSLEGERETLLTSTTLTADVSRRAVGEYLMKTYNNLGVVLHHANGRSMSDGRSAVQAEVALLRAVSLWDALSRDPETRARVISQELPGLNLREVLHPVAESELQIYDSLPPFLDRAPIEWGF